jgi:hypothetical protein
MMRKTGVLVFALFLIFAFGSQVFAEDIGAGTTGRTTDGTGVGTRGINTPDIGDRDNLGTTFDRTQTPTNRLGDGTGTGMRGTGVGNGMGTRGYTTTAADGNNGWGWLGILGLLGLAGMFGRNKNPER